MLKDGTLPPWAKAYYEPYIAFSFNFYFGNSKIYECTSFRERLSYSEDTIKDKKLSFVAPYFSMLLGGFRNKQL